MVNYCPCCKVVLSERGFARVESATSATAMMVQKSKDVWYLRITAYADKLLEGLDMVDFPANIRHAAAQTG